MPHHRTTSMRSNESNTGLGAPSPADAATLTGSTSRFGSDKAASINSTTKHETKKVDGIEDDIERNVANTLVTEKDASGTNAAGGVPDGVLEGSRLYLVFLAMMFAVFMFALDQSIVATAIPYIASDFKAFAAVPWIVTSYFLTQCGFILLVGQLLTVFKAKWILLWAIAFFELGSLLCALANSMTMLIVARAIQGMGASGMFVTIVAIISVVTRVEKRAAFMAGFGFVFVVSSVIGPLLGGVFTKHLTWKWCFWINLPFGAVAAAAVVFLLPGRNPDQTREDGPKTWQEALRRMDWLGSALVLLFITCLLLALQWGGNNYPWHNWRIILLFILGGLLVIAFFVWEAYYDRNALMPWDLLSNRTILAASGAAFMLMLAMLGGTYQLPLFYQAGRGHDAQKSGIDIIPFMIIVCIGIFVSGAIVTKTGHYWTFLIIGPPIAAVGFGLLYTLREDTSNAKVIGFQLLAGFGIGLTFQNIILSAQAEFAKTPALIPQATSIVSFFQLTGAAIGVGIVNTVQSVYLNRFLHEYAPDAPFALVRQSTTAIRQIPLELQAGVIHAYILAISKSYIPIFIALAFAVVFGAFIRNHNMLKLGVTPGMAA